MASSICIFSLKGGVGKTISAVNLSAALALGGRWTVLIDCDPQAGATAISGILPMRLTYNLGDALRNDVDIQEIIAHTCLLQFKVIPAPFSTEGHAHGGTSLFESTDAWDRLLTRLKKKFEFIVLDTPSANGRCAAQALANADAVVIPVQSEYLALRDLRKSLKHIKTIHQTNSIKLRHIGILLTMHRMEEMISIRILASVRKHLSRRLLDAIIPWDYAVSRSAAQGMPGVVTSPGSPGALAYRQLAVEFIERLRIPGNS